MFPKCLMGMELALWALTALGETGEPVTEYTLTIYSTQRPGAISPELYQRGAQPVPPAQIPGHAIVQRDTTMTLDAGRNSVPITDVAPGIDPTTVRLTSLTDPEGLRVLEQSFQFESADPKRLLERFTGREIHVEQSLGDRLVTYTGTLLNNNDGLVLQNPAGELQLIQGDANVRFSDPPKDLITQPTLRWEIETKQAGSHRTRISYATDGLTWWADYDLLLTQTPGTSGCSLEVNPRVNVLNRSRITFPKARLKLIAGEIHRAPTTERGATMLRASAELSQPSAEFQQQPFHEYHLYTLAHPVTLPDQSLKQIGLFPPVGGVSCATELIYEGSARFGGIPRRPITDRGYGYGPDSKVESYLRFVNSRDNHLGRPLPAGRVRVSQRDPSDGSTLGVGEAVLDHTPQGREVRLHLGSAFDVTAKRKQMAFAEDKARGRLEEDIAITLHNGKDRPVTVNVRESLYRWRDWEIVQASHTYEKIDAGTIQFAVLVQPDQETQVVYKVLYRW